MIDFIDLFSGIGGFRLGLEKTSRSFNIVSWRPEGMGNQEGRCKSQSQRGRGGLEQGSYNDFRCVWSCDNNKYANQVYTKHFGEANHHTGDIRGIDPEKIPDFDLLCAGFPCQAFSVAGKRKGFEDTRGTLFFEICRIADAKRPSLLLLENVRGLLSHDKGLTFQVILESLEELGYWAEWQVLNSKYFGVPQNRQRVFLVGHLGGRGGREIFPVGEADGLAQGEDERKREQISLAIDRNYWKGPDKHGQRTVIGVPRSRSVVVLADRTRTLAGKGRNLESPKPITNALSGVQKDNLLLENMKIRRLTPVECERLQGYPDGWTDGLSDTQRYKCLGNAVTTNVVEFLGYEILRAWIKI